MVPAEASDRWIDVLVDTGLTEDRYIKAIEVKPIKGFRAVHHVTTSMKHDDDPDDGDNVQGHFSMSTRSEKTPMYFRKARAV